MAAQATTTTTRAAAPPSTARGTRHRRRAPGRTPPTPPGPPAVQRLAPVTRDGRASASANSVVVGKRSAGTFARARRMASSAASGIVARTIEGGETVSSECRAMMACAVGPVNGGSPTSIS